jgi:hypothetical protein
LSAAARSAQRAGIDAFSGREPRCEMQSTGKDGARRFALKLSVTLFPALLQSVPLPQGARSPITISGATFRASGMLLCLRDAPFSPRLEIDGYLTKVR